MLNLSIQHNIYLTRDQRYSLHGGQDLEALGVSIPIWYQDKRTSEPAQEVFCRYYLKNPHEDVPVKILDDGYEISLPCRAGEPLNLTDQEWRELNYRHPDVLSEAYEKAVREASSLNLLDVGDGGCQCLLYRERSRGHISNIPVEIVHHVRIEDMQKLVSSLS